MGENSDNNSVRLSSSQKMMLAVYETECRLRRFTESSRALISFQDKCQEMQSFQDRIARSPVGQFMAAEDEFQRRKVAIRKRAGLDKDSQTVHESEVEGEFRSTIEDIPPPPSIDKGNLRKKRGRPSDPKTGLILKFHSEGMDLRTICRRTGKSADAVRGVIRRSKLPTRFSTG